MRLTLFFLLATSLWMAAAKAAELQPFPNCKLVPTEWADGDSFLVQFPDGQERTLRLYGVDCIELHVSTDNDAGRLMAQRRHFGISNYGGNKRSSVDKAKEVAQAAANKVQSVLQHEFIVYTALANARGDGRYERYYAFIETSDGEDLGELLVREGLARAYGVFRGRHDGVPRNEYEHRLKDVELKAAKQGKGIWEFTDWDSLPKERQHDRMEQQELAVAKGHGSIPLHSINPNTAARDQLMQLPGIGETLAIRIIEQRESAQFQAPADLLQVHGIGEKILAQIREHLVFAD